MCRKRAVMAGYALEAELIPMRAVKLQWLWNKVIPRDGLAWPCGDVFTEIQSREFVHRVVAINVRADALLRRKGYV